MEISEVDQHSELELVVEGDPEEDVIREVLGEREGRVDQPKGKPSKEREINWYD